MDKKDVAILNSLKQNAKYSTNQIAKKTLIPITTVHHRIKKLEKEGIIKGYTVIIDSQKIGKPISAYILVTVDYKLLKQFKLSQQDLVNKIRKLEGIEEAHMVTGGTDIILKVNVESIETLNHLVTERLRNLEAIDKTQTMVILN